MTKPKSIPVVFDTLISRNTPFAVLISYLKMVCLHNEFEEQYTVLGSKRKDQALLRELGFRQTANGHDLVMEYEMADADKRCFQEMIRRGEMKMVQDDENGKIYEWSKCNDFAAYCGKVKNQPKP